MPWHGYGYGYGWGWHLAGMFIFWIVLVIVIILLVRWFGAPGRGAGVPPHESPEEILKKRYARGEIDKEEFDRRLTDLRR